MRSDRECQITQLYSSSYLLFELFYFVSILFCFILFWFGLFCVFCFVLFWFCFGFVFFFFVFVFVCFVLFCFVCFVLGFVFFSRKLIVCVTKQQHINISFNINAWYS